MRLARQLFREIVHAGTGGWFQSFDISRGGFRKTKISGGLAVVILALTACGSMRHQSFGGRSALVGVRVSSAACGFSGSIYVIIELLFWVRPLTYFFMLSDLILTHATADRPAMLAMLQKIGR